MVNMMWKTTPEAWSKGVWWDLRKRMDWGEYEGESNPLVPHPIVQYLWYVLMIFMASEESPTVLARGNPMNPAREANEDWARTPPHPKATTTLKTGRRSVCLVPWHTRKPSSSPPQ